MTNSTHATPTAVIMPKSCIVCRAVASQDILLQYCSACQSALYCSKACQAKDWKKQHKKMCKLVNVGHGDMQVRTDKHKRLSIDLKEQIERYERSIDKDGKRFFKLFRESTFEGSQAAALEMKEIAKRQTKHNQQHLLLNSLLFLSRYDSEMLSWPNSPLLVMLQFVDPNMLSGEGTPLHHSADLADPFDFSTHKKQLILAKQLIEHGANVNAALSRKGETPLHSACHGHQVTNLDFIEFLLAEGADPNAQDHVGRTPLMYTVAHGPSAAKYLLNWPTTDPSISEQSGATFLGMVRSLIIAFSNEAANPENPERVQHKFLVQQWIEIEEMLLEKGARDTGIYAF
jgi:hypothetical protein